MALTRIKRHMIADSAVMPNNLVSTATYTVGGVASSGAVTGTSLVASVGVTAPKITVSGSSGLAVDTLRSNTGTFVTYYDPSTKELTYGPISSSGTFMTFDQNLNTTDRVRFAGVSATTATFNSTVTIGTGLINISTANGFRVSGIKPASQANLVMINTATGELTYFSSPGQLLSTSSSPTFANLTVTNTLKAGGNIYPTTYGSSGNFLVTDGFGTLSWSNQLKDVGLQGATTFLPYSLSGPTARLSFKTINNVENGSIEWTQSGFTASNVTLQGIGSLYLDGPGFQNMYFNDTGIVLQSKPDVYTARLDFPDGDDNIKLTNGSYNWKFKNDGALQFPDGTTQTTAAGPIFDQDLNTTDDVTFKSVTVTSGSGIDYSGGIRSTGDLYLFGGSLGYNGPIRLFGSKVETAASILPKQFVNLDLGSPTQRWSRAWIKTVTVGTNTIYFEDDNDQNTSTFSISSGTIAVDGTAVVDQAVTTVSSPTFSSINGTTSTFEDIIVNSELFFSDDTVQTTAWTGSVDRITSGSYSVVVNSSGTLTLPAAGFQVGGINANGGAITEVDAIIGTTTASPLAISNGGNTWSFESTGTLQFPDGTQQDSAWTGTYSYNNLTDKPYIPNQSVDTNSSPQFQNLTVIGTMTTLNVTTENVTTENIVTQNFADGTSQTTAWTGTVASSQITSVSTSKVDGLSTIGYTGFLSDGLGQLTTSTITGLYPVAWTGKYEDLSGLPNQTLNTSSNVTFANVNVTANLSVNNGDISANNLTVLSQGNIQGGLSVSTGTRVGRTLTAGGFPVNSAGTATVSTTLPNYPSLVVGNFNGGLTPNIHVRGHGQNRPGGVPTTQGNPVYYVESSRGTAASPTAIAASDSLGGFSFMGYDGANWPADQTITSYNFMGFYATEAMTAVGTSTYQAGSGFNMFLQPQWTRPGSGGQTRQRTLFTSWTTSSTAPSIFNFLVGSGIDGTAPTMTMVDGTTYTGYGRTNFTEVNSNHSIIGVPAQDTAPDNASLTATVALSFVAGRRSGTSTRRNQIQTGDDLGVINFRGQTSNGSTGIGARGGVIYANALEAFTSTRYGTSIGIKTVNSGTIVESNRLLMTDREMLHNADSHTFRDKSNTFTAASISTSSVAFNAGAAITTYNRTYGEFCYTGATIVATATNTIYAFPLNTTNTASGVVIQSGQQIKFNQVGGAAFKIIMSLQTSQTVNSVAGMDFWLRKNGVDVPNSATQVDLLKDQKAVVAMDWLVTPAVNDYYEIVYAVDDTNLEFPWYAAQTSPYVRPAVPPIIVNVIPVGA